MGNFQTILSYDEAVASYLASVDYAANNSTAECRALIAAIDKLALLRPRSSQFGGSAGESVQFDWQSLKMVRDEAKAWLKSRIAADDPQIGYVNTGYYLE